MSINEKLIDTFIESFITLVFNNINNKEDEIEAINYIITKIKSKFYSNKTESYYCVYCGKQLSLKTEEHTCFRR